MNREIKFRFVYKSKITNDNDIRFSYLTLDELIDGVCGVMSAPRNWKKWELVAKDQYTGLKDNNGKEIYEGDIGELYSLNGILLFQGVIVYRLGALEINVKDGSRNWNHDLETFVRHCNGKIIGNIYENPELLNEEKIS